MRGRVCTRLRRGRQAASTRQFSRQLNRAAGRGEMICATKHSPRKEHTMSLFKRLFGPRRARGSTRRRGGYRAHPRPVALPHDPGRTRRTRIVIALSDAPRRREGGRRRSRLPQGTKCSRQPDARQPAARQSRQSSRRNSVPEETKHPQLSQTRRPTAVT